MYEDSFSLGGLKGQVVFGAILNQTLNFQQFFYIDGVMGVACSYSFAHDAPVYNLVTTGQIPYKFALCFDSSGEGGIFTLVFIIKIK